MKESRKRKRGLEEFDRLPQVDKEVLIRGDAAEKSQGRRRLKVEKEVAKLQRLRKKE